MTRIKYSPEINRNKKISCFFEWKKNTVPIWYHWSTKGWVQTVLLAFLAHQYRIILKSPLNNSKMPLKNTKMPLNNFRSLYRLFISFPNLSLETEMKNSKRKRKKIYDLSYFFFLFFFYKPKNPWNNYFNNKK